MLSLEESQWYRKRAWAEVNLDHLAHNMELIKSHLKQDVQLMAMVKGDAYGHGDEMLVPAIEQLGVDWFGVSELEEGLSLRTFGTRKPILIVSPPMVEYTQQIVDNDLTVTITTLEYAFALSQKAEELGVSVSAHIKVDTGMGRLGFSGREETMEETIAAIEGIVTLPNLNITGIFTHFATADCIEPELIAYKEEQFHQFQNILTNLQMKSIDLGLRHCCNSAAIMMDKSYQLDMVRAGNIIYGNTPGPRCEGVWNIKPLLTFFTKVNQVKTVPVGAHISYGCKFEAVRPTKVASVGLGYADGVHRLLTNRVEMIVAGQKVPSIGTICMDQMMLDVTGVDVKKEDVVTIVGQDGDAVVTWDDLAQWGETINYEVICHISRRVPKIYQSSGKDLTVLAYAGHSGVEDTLV